MLFSLVLSSSVLSLLLLGLCCLLHVVVCVVLYVYCLLCWLTVVYGRVGLTVWFVLFGLLRLSFDLVVGCGCYLS